MYSCPNCGSELYEEHVICPFCRRVISKTKRKKKKKKLKLLLFTFIVLIVPYVGAILGFAYLLLELISVRFKLKTLKRDVVILVSVILNCLFWNTVWLDIFSILFKT